MSYQFSENSAEGSDWIKVLLDTESIEVPVATENADYTYTPGEILTKTLWNQSGTIYIPKDGKQVKITGYDYNKFCPDISASISTKCVTGCTNTADSQVLYYWISERVYTFDISVNDKDYYVLGSDNKTYYASESPTNNEGSISVINDLIKKSTQLESLESGDFIAALNFYCGLKNNSQYADSTSTSWYKSVYTNGTNAAVYKAAGFDSYYFIASDCNHEMQKIMFSNKLLTETGHSIVQECIDYGEVVRLGIPGHAVYIDGYRKNETTGKTEYHINYGWGVNSSETTWYDLDSGSPEITYLTLDLSPDITVKVTNAKSEYYGGSFLRGMERINHIVNDKATTFTFTESVKDATLTLTAKAEITSKVDVAFKNINLSVQFDNAQGFSSKNAMSFEMNSGSILVNYTKDQETATAILVDSDEALSVTMNDSWIFSGYHKDGISYIYNAVNSIKDFSVNSVDPLLLAAVNGTALKSGKADDTVYLANNSTILGDIDLGGGKNTITIENGSLLYGGFTGAAGTLTVNMVINDKDSNGPMIAVESDSADNTLLSLTENTLNVTVGADIKGETFTLIMGASNVALRNYTIKLTSGSDSYTLDYTNRSQGEYALIYENNTISLCVDDGKNPIAPIVTADITEITNKDVTLTAVFPADAVFKEYKVNNGTWQSYPENGVVMPENGEVSFRSTDAAGNSSPVTVYNVTNIDKVAPTIPIVDADIKTLTNKPVTLTAQFENSADRNEYSIDNGEWIAYTEGGVVLKANATVRFRSVDAAGNISKEAIYVVDYIDTDPPEKPKFVKDINNPTQSNVTVSALFDPNSKRNQYSLDGGSTWQDYKNPILFTENGKVIFRSVDELGNFIESVCVVDNIDRVAPMTPFIRANTYQPTNKDVILTAQFESDADKNEYSINNGEWKTYNGNVVMQQNGSVRFRSTDAAGNISKITEYVVSNIDKAPPEKPEYTLSTEAWTSGAVIVSGTFAADSVKNEYKINNGEWADCDEQFEITQNSVVTLRSTDKAGNSSETTFTVGNIDKSAPTLKLNLSTKANTPRPVTVTATADDAGLSGIKSVEYSLDGKKWIEGTSVTVTKNQMVFFRASDNVGNTSLIYSEIINNITEQKPENNITGSGVSQIIGYDAANGKVGFVEISEESAPEWKGIWEWSGKEAAMWRVDGAGYFSGSNVNKDGILLYNGSNNTFAAWTDLGSGDYGYSSLLYADGSFKTCGVADFGGKAFDDIVIYDDKGSFGIALDGTRYIDVWHVEENQTSQWELLGVGSFDGKSANLIVKNHENNFITLWGNNDYTFSSWDWSVTSAGFVGNTWQFCGAGDFMGDGKDDILLRNVYNNELWVWEDGNASNTRWAGTLDEGFEVEAIGDYNGDCQDDILLREHITGWGGMGYWGAGYAGNWVDLNARIETNTKSPFAVIA